jgi:chromosome segregation ATPase
MTTQAYNDKNQADYDDNSDLINEALAKIKSKRSLKATIAQLCELTGFHRNTFIRAGPRGDVHVTLKKIKEERKIIDALDKQTKKDQIKELEEQLNNATKEVVYWFSQFDELQRNFSQLELRLKRQTESKDWYENELQKERENSKQLQARLEQTNELLRNM